MGNIIQVKQGEGKPTDGILTPGELGFDKKNNILYIGKDKLSIPLSLPSSNSSNSGNAFVGYIPLHVEGYPNTILPFVGSAISHLNLRDNANVAITEYYNNQTVGKSSSNSITNLFDSGYTYFSRNVTTSDGTLTKIEITLRLHKSFVWTNYLYIDMGGGTVFGAKTVTIEAKSYSKDENIALASNVYAADDNYTNYGKFETQARNFYVVKIAHKPSVINSSGNSLESSAKYGFVDLRITFKDFIGTSNLFRIAEIGIIPLNGGSVTDVCLPLSGGKMLGDIDFGEKSFGLKWKTKDGTQYALRPFVDTNLFQLVQIPSGSDTARAVITIQSNRDMQLYGNTDFGNATRGIKWKTNDGTQFYLRPYVVDNIFQLTRKRTDEANEVGVFSAKSDGTISITGKEIRLNGTVTLNSPLSITSGGTGATTIIGAKNNFNISCNATHTADTTNPSNPNIKYHIVELTNNTITTCPLDTFTTNKGFTIESNGVKCPYNGTIIISGSVYIANVPFSTVNSDIKVGCYIYKKTGEVETEIVSQYIENTGSGLVSAGCLVTNVSAGDIILLKGRVNPNTDNVTEQLYANLSHLSIAYI